MANVVVIVLSVTIGLFFVLIGTIKLSPVVSEEVYREMVRPIIIAVSASSFYYQLRKNFIRFTKVFPLVSITNWRPSPHVFRRVVGVTEVVGGLVLAIIPGPLKQAANVVLFLSCLVSIYSHYMLHDNLDRMTSSLIFGLLLACRFVVRLQVNAREVDPVKMSDGPDVKKSS